MGLFGSDAQIHEALIQGPGEQHCIMVALWIWEFGDQLYGRLLTGNNPLRALQSGEGDKAAETAAFLFRRLLQQPTFFLCVVGEHFRSKWGLAGAPGRNVIPFGHRLLWYYRTTQQRYYPTHCFERLGGSRGGPAM